MTREGAWELLREYNKDEFHLEHAEIEIRCRNGHCNRLFMNYYVTGNNVDLNLGGFELKCEKCKRVLRLKHYTEQLLIEHSENGVFRV